MLEGKLRRARPAFQGASLSLSLSLCVALSVSLYVLPLDSDHEIEIVGRRMREDWQQEQHQMPNDRALSLSLSLTHTRESTRRQLLFFASSSRCCCIIISRARVRPSTRTLSHIHTVSLAVLYSLCCSCCNHERPSQPVTPRRYRCSNQALDWYHPTSPR